MKYIINNINDVTLPATCKLSIEPVEFSEFYNSYKKGGETVISNKRIANYLNCKMKWDNIDIPHNSTIYLVKNSVLDDKFSFSKIEVL